jgi:hypothetical protein
LTDRVIAREREFESIANVTLRGNTVNGVYLAATERDALLCLRENSRDRPEHRGHVCAGRTVAAPRTIRGI